MPAPPARPYRFRCFAPDRARLVPVLALVRHSVRGVAVLDEEWCSLCGEFRYGGEPCAPTALT